MGRGVRGGGVVTIDIFDWNQYFSIAFLLRKINIDEVTHLGRNFPPARLCVMLPLILIINCF